MTPARRDGVRGSVQVHGYRAKPFHDPYDCIVKVARTNTDPAGPEGVTPAPVAEAIGHNPTLTPLAPRGMVWGHGTAC